MAQTASTRGRCSTTAGRRLTPTATVTSLGPRSTTATAPRRSSTATASSRARLVCPSTGRSTSRGGDDNVPAPVHRLRRTHADQTAEAEAVRAVRQGGGAGLLAVALPDVPRLDARVPPQSLPQEPRAHPRQTSGAPRREGAVSRPIRA